MKVTLLMALTLDGKIGKDSDHFPDWTEKADKKLFVELTKQAGVIIMGSKTYDTIGRPLPGRKNVVMTRSPEKRENGEDLEFTNKAPRELLEYLEAEGFSEAILAGGQQINGLFAQEKLIDEIVVTVSPKIFGKGLSLFPEDIQLELELWEVEKIGEHTVKAHYKVKK